MCSYRNAHITAFSYQALVLKNPNSKNTYLHGTQVNLILQIEGNWPLPHNFSPVPKNLLPELLCSR